MSGLSCWLKRRHPLAAGIDGRVKVDWVIRRAAVPPGHRYCYFRIPKCANSTVIKTLFRYDPSLKAGKDQGDPRRMKKRFGGLFSARALSPHQLSARYFCFTVVRSPFTRVLSAYLDKIAAAQPGQYSYVARAVGASKAAEVSFPDFVAFLEGGGLYANAHWAPQVAMLPVDPGELAYVGRVESLEDDLAWLVDRLFGKGTFEGAATRGDRRRHSGSRLREYYDLDLVRRVHRLYEPDFRAFGYAETPEF